MLGCGSSVASVHSGFRRDKAEQTARIIEAVSNPFTLMLGHITGRLLLRLPGYDLDIEEVLKTCAAHGGPSSARVSPVRGNRVSRSTPIASGPTAPSTAA